jgi:hypothetical protein
LTVLVLDENVFESQRYELLRRRLHLCQIGRDIGRKGMKDDEIIPLLRTLRRPTFISRDRDFFDKTLCSDRMCLVYANVRPLEVAAYARRLLRHPHFKAWSKRKGCVARVAASGISVWRTKTAHISRYLWVD